MRFIVFPTTLFSSPYLPSTIESDIDEIILIEEPIYIYDPKWQECRVNKNKIAFFRCAMKFYMQQITNIFKKKNIVYYDYEQALKLPASLFQDAHAWDPCDWSIKQKYNCIKFHTSPMFLLDHNDLETLYSKNTKRLAQVYEYIKSKIGVLQGIKSYDKDNRKMLPPHLIIPAIPTYSTSRTKKYYNEAIRYANTSKFRHHTGDPRNVILSPITHSDAMSHLAYFLKNKLDKFGPYQDAISKDHVYLFHANISHLLNIGLITPRDVLDNVLLYKNTVPLQSLEGFIRQLIGWREFMRYLYIKHFDVIIKPFKHSGPHLNPFTWKTRVVSIDNEIEKAKNTGYAHHIIRLMMFLNFMKLIDMPPISIYRWFMEVVSNDAYPWVMYTNIATMGYYTTIPFMQKPYISTSSYIQRMSDYKHRSDIWDSLFYRYIAQPSNLKSGAKVYLRNKAAFDRFPPQKRAMLLNMASNYLIGMHKNSKYT